MMNEPLRVSLEKQRLEIQMALQSENLKPTEIPHLERDLFHIENQLRAIQERPCTIHIPNFN